MTQQLSDIVRVTATISAAGTPRATLGRGLYLTRDGSVLDAAGARKVRVYNGLSEVSEDFAASLDPYRAAQRWFGQSPYPNKLLIGRWADSDVSAQVRGGVHDLIKDLDDISDGSFHILTESFTAVDLTSADTFEKVAAAVQTKLRSGSNAAFSTATVAYNEEDDRFDVSFTGVHPGALFSVHPGGTGTDLAEALGLDADSGASYHPPQATEVVNDALDAIRELDSSFYFVVIEPGLNDTETVRAVSAWAAANNVIFCAESNAQEVLMTGEEASVAAQLALVQSGHTLLTWSQYRDYKAVSIAARLSSVNFAVPGSLITAAFKQLPGCAPDDLASTQRAELERKRINYYVAVGGTNIYLEGWTLKPGVWVDVTYWIDWITDAIKTAVFNLLASSRRIPQTVDGIAAIREVIVGVCEEGVRNGGIAPGVVSAAMAARIVQVTGVGSFNGELPNGYLVHIGSLADQSRADRDARIAPPISVFLKGSGAVHSVDIDLTFEN